MLLCNWQLRRPVESRIISPPKILYAFGLNPVVFHENTVKTVKILYSGKSQCLSKKVKCSSTGICKGACSKGFWLCQIFLSKLMH